MRINLGRQQEKGRGDYGRGSGSEERARAESKFRGWRQLQLRQPELKGRSWGVEG